MHSTSHEIYYLLPGLKEDQQTLQLSYHGVQDIQKGSVTKSSLHFTKIYTFWKENIVIWFWDSQDNLANFPNGVLLNIGALFWNNLIGSVSLPGCFLFIRHVIHNNSSGIHIDTLCHSFPPDKRFCKSKLMYLVNMRPHSSGTFLPIIIHMKRTLPNKIFNEVDRFFTTFQICILYI